MSEVSALSAIKSLSEATHSNVRSVSDFLTEVSESSSMAHQEITSQLRAVREDAKLCKDISPRIEAQVASNTSLLKDLKVRVVFNMHCLTKMLSRMTNPIL